MPTTSTITVQYPALRLLTAADLVRSLDRFRLPHYGWIGSWLSERQAAYHLAELWRGVFGEDPPAHLSIWDAEWDAEIEFVWRVHNELFAVDLNMMDMYYNSGENPLECPIAVGGLGVPWEVDVLEFIVEYAQPMVAVLGAAGEIQPDGLADWWEARHYDEPPQLHWPADAMDRLHRLPQPLDGLTVLYHAVVKNTGNLFLDVPAEAKWQCEYWPDVEYWTVGYVQDLASEFSRVREDVSRLEAYIQWFEDIPGSESRVLAILLDLCEESDDNSD